MKAEITREGVLMIRRGDEMKAQHCVYRHGHYCCDLCPAFGEVEQKYEGRTARLNICHGGVYGQITDLRAPYEEIRAAEEEDRAPAAERSDADGGL
jgi:hypothetical protein